MNKYLRHSNPFGVIFFKKNLFFSEVTDSVKKEYISGVLISDYLIA